jgi:hypothetical protein
MVSHLREHASGVGFCALARCTQQRNYEKEITTMKVHELIALLEETDPNAEIYLMTQVSWPFEYSIAGVAVRGDFARGEDGGRDTCPNDVFILEAKQERYGSEAAWRVGRR